MLFQNKIASSVRSTIFVYSDCRDDLINIPSINANSNIFSLGSPTNNDWAMIRYGENQPEAIGGR